MGMLKCNEKHVHAHLYSVITHTHFILIWGSPGYHYDCLGTWFKPTYNPPKSQHSHIKYYLVFFQTTIFLRKLLAVSSCSGRNLPFFQGPTSENRNSFFFFFFFFFLQVYWWLQEPGVRLILLPTQQWTTLAGKCFIMIQYQRFAF